MRSSAASDGAARGIRLAGKKGVYTDRDLCKSLLKSAAESFGTDTIAVLLNVTEAEVRGWIQGRMRPPTHYLLQVIDLMRPKTSDTRPGQAHPRALRVLVATSRRVRDHVARIVQGCPVDFASSMEDGEAALRDGDYSHVIIGYLFAESQMFEFARQARLLRPTARVICVKASGRMLHADVRSGLDAAAVELGCEGFFDLTAGELPETFNQVFNEILEYFRAEEHRSRQAAVEQELRNAVRQLRAMA
jgi:hypothetical protein